MMLNRMQNRARLTRLATPQVERNRGTWLLTRSSGVPNWPADEWERLDSFLIFGRERDAHVLRGRIEADGPRVVRRVVELVSMGRVVSDEPCLTALALCAALGNEATRTMVLEAAAEVAAPELKRGGERGAVALSNAAAPHPRLVLIGVVECIYESTSKQREVRRAFDRERRREEKADRRPWEEDD